jgi:hypothetical protein
MVADIHRIFERGGDSELRALLRVIHDDPFGQVASRALQAAHHSDVYGTPALIIACLEADPERTRNGNLILLNRLRAASSGGAG